MRIVGRFPDQRQASASIDSLRNIGFDRADMIVSTFAKEKHFDSDMEAAQEIIFTKSERDGLGEYQTFTEGIKGLAGEEGIVVAVKTPKHKGSRVREIMEQSGAVEIIQD